MEQRYFQEQQRVKELEAWRADAEEVYSDIKHQIAELHAAKKGTAFSEKYRINIPCEYLRVNRTSDVMSEVCCYYLMK